MLIPLVSLPRTKTHQTPEKDNDLKVFIRQLGILGPVLLQSHNVLDSDIPFPVPAEELYELGEISLEGFLSTEVERAAKLLDKGLQIVYFNNIADEEVLTKDHLCTLPRNRVGLSSVTVTASIQYIQETVREYSAVVEHFLFKVGEDSVFTEVLELYKLSKRLATDTHVKVSIIVPPFVSNDLAILAGVSELLHVVFEPCLQLYTPTVVLVPSTVMISPTGERSVCSPYSKHLMTPIEDKEQNTHVDEYGHVEYLSVFIARLRSDRQDGLFTSVVCDEQGVCLGLVYSNAESIRHAVSQKRGVFWSRSRGGLWIKGETSGMWQELLKIDVDCDADALRFTVKQHGDPPSFCHLLTRTCWGEPRGLQKLEALLRDRKKAAPEGSYTKRLFNDPSLLRKKLLEEVQELVEATDPGSIQWMKIRSNSPDDHIAAEAADVLYFALTRCVSAGVGISEIEAHLDKRSLKVSRRPGDAKEWRTKAAEQVLIQMNSEARSDRTYSRLCPRPPKDNNIFSTQELVLLLPTQ